MIELKYACIGVRCSVCGKSIIEHINSFQLASGVNIICRDCGAPVFSIRKSVSNNLMLNCFACGKMHTYTLSKNSFFSGKPISFCCMENEIDVFFAGLHDEVDDALFRLSEHIKTLTDKYYENFEKKYGSHASAALRILEEKAMEKRIFCLCGNYELNIKIIENAIQLICPNCGSSVTIPITNDKDITLLMERRSIFIK